MLWYHLSALFAPPSVSFSSITLTNRDWASHLIYVTVWTLRILWTLHIWSYWRKCTHQPLLDLDVLTDVAQKNPPQSVLHDSLLLWWCICSYSVCFNPPFSLLVHKYCNTHIYTPNKHDWLVAMLKLGVSCCVGVRGVSSKVSTHFTFLFVSVDKPHSHMTLRHTHMHS